MSKPLTVSQFREKFPAFESADFPDYAIAVRLRLANKFFDECIWNDEELRDHAMGLYVAHFLTSYGSAASGGSGYVAGSGSGVVSSKSVDGASVSYDTGSSMESDAGFWNSSPYGKELWQLMRIFGSGAVQL